MYRFISRAVSLFLLLILSLSAMGAEQQPLKVLLVSGSGEYQSNESLAALEEYLEKNYSVEAYRAFAKSEKDKNLPGIEQLEQVDVMLLFTRRLPLEGADLQRIKQYALAGKPIVGVRTASHAIQTWLELDKEVFGGDYQGHFGKGPKTQVQVVEAAKDHPVLQGVEAWQSVGSLYKNPDIADDTMLLLRGSLPDGHTEPVAWVRKYRGGRVFYTSLGHPEDFEQESFRRLLANALFWTAGRRP